MAKSRQGPVRVGARPRKFQYQLDLVIVDEARSSARRRLSSSDMSGDSKSKQGSTYTSSASTTSRMRAVGPSISTSGLRHSLRSAACIASASARLSNSRSTIT